MKVTLLFEMKVSENFFSTISSLKYFNSVSIWYVPSLENLYKKLKIYDRKIRKR